MAITMNKAEVKFGGESNKEMIMKALARVDIKGWSSFKLDLEKSTLVVMSKGNLDTTALVNDLRKYVRAKLVKYGPVRDEGPSLQKALPPQKQKALQPQPCFGFSSIKLDHEKMTLVVNGVTDPTVIVNQLKKFVGANLVTYGPGMGEGRPQPPKNPRTLQICDLSLSK